MIEPLHKAYLATELENKGFNSAVKYKLEEDVEYITSIKDEKYMDVMKKIEQELYGKDR
jgi:hypothetical protein